MMIKKEDVLEALKSVLDPDSGKDIVSGSQVSDLAIEDDSINFKLVVKNPAMQHKKRMEDACLFAIERNFGKEVKCTVEISSVSSAPSNAIKGVKQIIAVASGKGGVGKSTVTSNLALGLKNKGYKVAIVDADVYGPSIPIMFNVADERPASVPVEGSNKMLPVIGYGIQIMSLGFFAEPDQPIVWRGAMVSKALKQMFFETEWDDVDYMLVDLPPGTGDIHLSLVQSTPVSSAIMVTTPQDVAIADVRKGVAMFKMPNVNVPVLGIIENMSWFTPEELPENKYYIFGKDGAKNLAADIKTKFLGEIPLIQSIRESGDIGRPVAMQNGTILEKSFNEITKEMVAELLKRNENLPPTEVVRITTMSGCSAVKK
jgi:ATP-binding protein involved in chromosome partitioning